MKDGFIKVCAATPDIQVADTEFNTEQIIRLIREAASNQAKLIVLPELCITGYTCGELFLQSALLQGAQEGLLRMLKETAELDILCCVGLPVIKDQKLYNCCAVFFRGRLLALIPKKQLPNYSEFYEKRYFSPAPGKNCEFEFLGQQVIFGNQVVICDKTMPSFCLGVEICEDLWGCEPPSGRLALSGATVIANLSASNETVGKADYRSALIQNQSARLFCAYVYADAGDGESTGDLVFAGDNLIAENGHLLSRSKRFHNEAIYGIADLDRLLSERLKTTTFQPDENQCEKIFISFSPVSYPAPYSDPLPFVPQNREKRPEICEDILTIQAMGLKKRIAHAHAKTAVTGVSGGLDSTLALLVTVRAFDLLDRDRKDIIAVTMPCFGTTSRTYQNACDFADSLGVALKEINIKDSVLLHFRDIGHSNDVYDVTFENAQARERTQVLMDVANQTGGLVIGTGDLSELALGWATYNGDHMSMYGVNSGVPKTLIRYLVEYEADKTKNEILSKTLRDILDTPVSPELLPPKDGEIAQKTEHIVGPYELHDFFL